jgi:predicted lipid-binding transport protein (Tim44 family)
MNGLLGTILAAAGGGSSGFSGGGGGGGGGFSGGGGGGFGGGGAGTSGGASVFTILLIVALVLAVAVTRAWQAHRVRKRRRDRVRQVELAAAEAATDDADFDPEAVRMGAAALFVDIQRYWSANDIEKLEKVVGEDLMVEWRRRLQDFKRKGWQNRCEPIGTVKTEYVGLVNREGEDEDRVVVRVTASLNDYVVTHTGEMILKDGQTSKSTKLTEWWTLQPPGQGRWRLLSIESAAEGLHHLDSELVAVPWADGRVADAALVETAVADVVPTGVSVSEIAPAELDPDARAAALDLALADGRFAPDVLEVAARRAVEAWVEAIDGEDGALEALADRPAIDRLLYGGGDATGRTRVVVRGARVEKLAIAALDPHATPATMTAAITLKGVRYVEDRDTAAVLDGRKGADSETLQRWTFALAEANGGDGGLPWRLVSVV